MSGLKLALQYSYPPFQLGLCGPQDEKTKKILADFVANKKIDEREIRKILEQFQGAYAYYELIARCNNIDDPFDERVVRAYWTGNQLLENVPIEEIKRMVQEDFNLSEKAAQIPEGSKPHHSFHVMIIGSVTGRIKFNHKLRALCRISWKKVGNKWMSFHWNHPCEILDEDGLDNLKKYTIQ